MNRIRLMFLAVAVTCLCSAAFADSTFENSGGTLTSKTGATGFYLQSSGSMLSEITNLGAYNCSGLASQGGSCSGTVSFTTSFTNGLSAGLINTFCTGQIGSCAGTSFGPGGKITITENGTTVFSGTFTNATWTYIGTCSASGCGTGQYYEWELSGNMTGTIVGGSQANGAFVQLTTQKMHTDPFAPNGTGRIGLSGGVGTLTTPETGTLVLFGTGLVGIALLTRRKGFGVRT